VSASKEHVPPVTLPPKPDGPRTPPHLATLLSDTSPEVDAVLVGMLRTLTDSDRYRRAASLTEFAVTQSKRAIRRAHPDWSPREVDVFFVRLCHGNALADQFAAHLAKRSP
jgi:hypothetical protein